MMYTPGDWPALPQQPVRVGDTWSVDTGSGRGELGHRGRASYTLTKVEQVGQQRVAHIEGIHDLQMNTDRAGPSRVTSFSRFDLAAGRFIEEQANSQLQVEIAPGQRVTLHSSVTRRLAQTEAVAAEPEDSGEYLFCFDADQVHPVAVAGKRFESPTKPVTQMMYLLL